MRKLKYLVGALAVVATVLTGAQPGHATSAMTVPFDGTLHIGSGLSYTAGIAYGGSGACLGGATGAPVTATAALCSVGGNGTVQGTCAAWTANVTGWIAPSIDALGTMSWHNTSFTMIQNGGNVTITGTARDAAGTLKQVIGQGIIQLNWNTGSTCVTSNGLASYFFVGSLTVLG